MPKGNAGSKTGETKGRQVSFWSHDIRLIDRAFKRAKAGSKLTRSQWLDEAAIVAAKAELEKK